MFWSIYLDFTYIISTLKDKALLGLEYDNAFKTLDYSSEKFESHLKNVLDKFCHYHKSFGASLNDNEL